MAFFVCMDPFFVLIIVKELTIRAGNLRNVHNGKVVTQPHATFSALPWHGWGIGGKLLTPLHMRFPIMFNAIG